MINVETEDWASKSDDLFWTDVCSLLNVDPCHAKSLGDALFEQSMVDKKFTLRDIARAKYLKAQPPQYAGNDDVARQDPAMLAFWQAVWDADVGEDNVLDLGDTKLVDKHTRNRGTKKLYVRGCYPALSKKLMEAREMKKNVVVSGSPGVGKTAYRNYHLYYLVQEIKAGGPAYTIVLHSTPGEPAETCVVLKAKRDGTDVHLSAHRIPRRSLETHIDCDDPHLVYLVDVSEGDSKEKIPFPAGCTVMFTSPNERAFKEFGKTDLFGDGPMYMPLWKLPEAQAAARMCGIDADADAFKEKWRRYGGVPRALLEARSYENTVINGLKKMDWSMCTQSVGRQDNSGGVVHRLLYYRVEEVDGGYDFHKASLFFGTDYILTLAADKYLEEMADAVNTVMHSTWPGVSPGVKGSFLEAVAHRALCWSNDLLLRRIKHSSRDLFSGHNYHLRDDASPLKWTWFANVDEAVRMIKDALDSGRAVYLRPSNDQFPAVDAILVTATGKVLLLQMTISGKHAIDGPEAKPVFAKLVAASPGKEVALVWVVPSAHFKHYPQQSVPKVSKGKRVRQYALAPPAKKAKTGAAAPI